MIDVTRIDHISMAVPALDPQIELLERLFGFRYRGRFTQDGYVGVELEVPGHSGIGWEILAPDGPGSYLHRFMDGENGPGLHHLAMQVRDMSSAVETMRDLGVEPWGYEADEDPTSDPTSEAPLTSAAYAPPNGGGGREDQANAVAYIHPRGGGAGFLFQLYEGAPWHLPEPFEDDRSDSLGITAINAIGHAHHSRQELGDWYERLFGFRTIHRSAADSDLTSFGSRVLETPGGQLRIEVTQPTREDSFLQRFLDRRGPAVHHISFEVGDMARALRACQRNGVRVFGERSGESEGAHWQEAFMAPEQTGGMLVQLFAWQPLASDTPPTPSPWAPPVGPIMLEPDEPDQPPA